MKEWKLVHRIFEKEIKVGDTLETSDGEKAKVTGFDPPHRDGVSGRVYVEWTAGQTVGMSGRYYVTVFGCKYV